MDKRNILLAVAAAALALCAVAILLMDNGAEAPAQPPAATSTPAQETDPPDKPSAADLWSDDGTLHRLKPLDVDLDAETQWAIYRACDYDPGLFCLIMAIADHESGFDSTIQGDEGGSHGMMQINVKWHLDRMERLGVTDLTDPVQCATVAIDYLQELESRYGFAPLSNELLMAYNMGPSGARKALNSGTASTAYSLEVMSIYQGYLEELEGTP